MLHRPQVLDALARAKVGAVSIAFWSASRKIRPLLTRLSQGKVCRQAEKYVGTISRRTFPMLWLMSGIANEISHSPSGTAQIVRSGNCGDDASLKPSFPAPHSRAVRHRGDGI